MGALLAKLAALGFKTYSATKRLISAIIDAHVDDETIHFTESEIDHTHIQNVGSNTHAQIDSKITEIDSHIAETDNPHEVTKTQVGLGNVDDVKQLPNSYLDTDVTLNANSDVKVPSQKAVKAYVDTSISYGISWKTPVIDKDLSTPPAEPEDGDRYIVGQSATGDWAGHENDIAEYTYPAWAFETPMAGFAVITTDDGKGYSFNDSNDWVLISQDLPYTADEETLELKTREFSIKDGGVGTEQIADEAVTTDKLADESVTNDKIAEEVSPTKGGTGLSELGSAHEIIGVNPAGDGLEYKRIIAGENVTVTESEGQIEISAEGAGGASDFIYQDIALQADASANFTYTNLPAALTAAAAQLRKKVNLTGAVQFRIVVNQQVAGYAGSKLRVRYSTNNSTFLDIDADNSGDLDVGTGTGVKVGAWTDIVSGAKQDVWLQLYGLSGDGIVDPAFRQISIQLKCNSSVVDGGAEGVIYTAQSVHSHPNSALTVTALPLAVQEFPYTNGRGRFRFDSTNVSQFRIEVRQGTAGYAGSDINLQYSINNGTSWANAFESSDGELDIGTGANTTKIGSWATLIPAAKGDYLWRLISKEGNGVISPTFYQIKVHFSQNSAGAVTPAGSTGEFQVNDDGELGVVPDNGMSYDSETETVVVRKNLSALGDFSWESVTDEYTVSRSALSYGGNDYNQLLAGEAGVIDNAVLFINSLEVGEDGPDIEFAIKDGPVKEIATDAIDGTQDIGVALLSFSGDPAWKATLYFPSGLFEDASAVESFFAGLGTVTADYFRSNIFTNNGANNDYTFANQDGLSIVDGDDDPATAEYGSEEVLLAKASNEGGVYIYSEKVFVLPALRLTHQGGSYLLPTSEPSAGDVITMGEDGDTCEWVSLFDSTLENIVWSNVTGGKVTFGVGESGTARFNVIHTSDGDAVELGFFGLKPNGTNFGDSYITIRGYRQGIARESTTYINFDNYDGDEYPAGQYTMGRVEFGNPSATGRVGDMRIYLGNAGSLIKRMDMTNDGDVTWYGVNPSFSVRSSEESGQHNMAEFRLIDGGNNWMHGVLGLVGEDGYGNKGDTIIMTRQSGSDGDVERIRFGQTGYVHVGGPNEGFPYPGIFGVGNMLSEFVHNNSNYGFQYNGTYTGSTQSDYIVEIDSEGTPDTFKWSDNGGSSYTTGVAITGDWQTLSNGVAVKFDTTDENTTGDQWTFSGYPDLFHVTDSKIATKNIEPVDDNTYYIGRNDDDSPKAFKGVILKDTTDGKYYRIEVTSGSVVATDLTD